MKMLVCLLALFGGPTAHVLQEPFQIRVDVDLVLLNTTVRDKSGKYTPDLQETDFAVAEDGVVQKLRFFRHEDVPATVGLVVDHSGSMKNKLDEVLTAARSFVRLSNPDDQLFVVNFNEKVRFGLPAGMAFTKQTSLLESALMTPATGQTALYDAVLQGLEGLKKGQRDRNVLIVISDGGDNASHHPLEEVLRLAGEGSALVYTVGIYDDTNPDRNPDVLRRLARETGGEAFFPKRVEELAAVCERIAMDVRSQYTLGYVSSNPSRVAGYRRIRVNLTRDFRVPVTVRARAGYRVRQ